MDRMLMFKDFCENSIQANDVDPAVSYLNYIVDRMEMNDEQVLWLCFLFAVTYHLPSAYLIWNEYPDLEIVGIPRLQEWWQEKQKLIPFQTDKMKQRRSFVDTVESYKNLVGASQKSFFDPLLSSDDPNQNFEQLWTHLKGIKYFGRFSIWNWCQMLKHVAGYNIEPNKLMLGNPDAVSFTDGLAYARGFDDKVTHKVVENGRKRKIHYKWSDEEKDEMEVSFNQLKMNTGLDNFELETLACAFKKIWRDNDSRYVGYYHDRIAEDIKKIEPEWYGVDWKLLWDARDYCIPAGYNNGGIDKTKFKWSPEDKVKSVGREVKMERVLVNIRGTNGSGKSTIAMSMMDDPKMYVKGLGEGGKAPYITIFPTYKWVALGRYKDGLKTGGMDGFKNNEMTRKAFWYVMEKAKTYDILMEGVIASTVKSTYAILFHEAVIRMKNGHYPDRRIIIANFIPPEDVCIERVMERNGGKPVKEDQIRSKWRTVNRNVEYFKEQGFVTLRLNTAKVAKEDMLPRFMKTIDKQRTGGYYDKSHNSN